MIKNLQKLGVAIINMIEPIKWHEPENSSKFLTFEDIDKIMKGYNPREFRRQYLNLRELSNEAKAARMPPKPEDLVGSLQDPIHRDVERSRPARAVKSRKIT